MQRLGGHIIIVLLLVCMLEENSFSIAASVRHTAQSDSACIGAFVFGSLICACALFLWHVITICYTVYCHWMPLCRSMPCSGTTNRLHAACRGWPAPIFAPEGTEHWRDIGAHERDEYHDGRDLHIKDESERVASLRASSHEIGAPSLQC